MKKSYVFTINQTQKIIYSISSFLILLIISYVIAENIDYRLQIRKTWMVWIFFLIIQTWLQNKIWNANTEIKFNIHFPNLYNIIKFIKTLKNKIENKFTLNNQSDFKQSNDNLNKADNSTNNNIYILYFVLLIISVLLFIIYSYSKKTIETTKYKETTKWTNEYSLKEDIDNTSNKIENKTVSKLLQELYEIKINYYEFNDPKNQLGYKFSTDIPISMKVYSKKKNECSIAAKIIDNNNNSLTYTAVINRANIPEMSVSDMDDILKQTPQYQIDEVYKKMAKDCKVINAGTLIDIGSIRIIYFDLKLSEMKGSIFKYNMIRSYFFYLKNGTGQLGFYLQSNNETQVEKDFEDYKILYETIVNKITLSKTN